MKMILALISAFLVSNSAQAGEFELKVYFNLAAAEKHGMVHCAIGGKKLKTEYHLAVFKDKPNYTILGNLELDENITADVERKLLCNEGDFTLVKSIKTPEDSINLFIYLEEIYFIKDQIFDVANVKLTPDEDYFLQKKYISEAGVMVVETMNTNESTNNDATLIKRSDLIYNIEIKRM